jgi:hypothetical protein
MLKRNEQVREDFKRLINGDFRLEQLVFADESRFNGLTLKRPYAWSIHGERASRFEFSLRGQTYSLLPALSLDGVLHLEVVENAVSGDDFLRFVQGLLPQMNKWPLNNSVLVIDNASIHNVAGIREAVEDHGARLLFLPLYSPDFNPIELAFSTIKAWLRRYHERVDEGLQSENGVVYDIFWEAVQSITVGDAKGWYKQCGYTLGVE